MTKEEIQEQINKLQAALDGMQEEELKPKDWKGEDCYNLDFWNEVEVDRNASGKMLFYARTEEELKPIQSMLKELSVLWNLKQALGDTETGPDGILDKYTIIRDIEAQKWIVVVRFSHRFTGVWFTVENAQKALDYMNKTYPDGVVG